MNSRTKGWMVALVALAGLVGFVFLLPTPEEPTAQMPPLPSGSFVIRDVRLFDGERVVEKTTVRVEGGKITGLGESSAGDSVPIVDGTGRTLLPGLIDAHTHSWGDALERAAVFGVTTQLDQFGDLGMARASHGAEFQGAELFTAGTLVTSAGGHGTQFRPGVPTLESAADADAFVAARLAEGSDWIKLVIEDGHELGMAKLLPTLDAATVRAVVDAAHRRKALVVAHVHALDAAEMAVDAGIDGLVHTVVDVLPSPEFARRVAERGVFVVPTLSVLGGGDQSARLAKDPHLVRYLTRGEATQLASPGVLSRMKEGEERPRSLARESVRVWRQAGVKLLAGTDAANPGTTWGASLHGELELLVGAGLPPSEALAAATSRAADGFRLADRGRIAVGKRADLLLVEGDPTRDVSATRAILGVWRAGRSVARSEAVAVVHPTLPETPTQGFEAGQPPSWMTTTDAMRGGASTVALTMGEENGGHFLHVAAETRAGFPYPWAGAMWALREPDGGGSPLPINLGERTHLSFRSRGAAFNFLVLVDGMAQPIVHPIEGSADWREQQVDLKALEVPTDAVTALIFSAGPEIGSFTFDLDDVALRAKPPA